ncbi:MAG TPA: hypothetical protein DDY90_02230 [Clostridiales bacterium]|nr:hypothetical protein [Clostridiales bacterium]HBK25565.1 hypothetical protein [Clostridiales bacterium]
MRSISREEKSRNYLLIAFFLVTGLSLYVFYTVVHPMYIFDLDDWFYISYGRHAFPTTSLWNPSKVMPETLLPLVSYIGAYFVYPLTGDYIQSLCCVHALTTILFIMTYLLYAGKVLAKRFSLDKASLTVFLAAFLLAHFTPFLVKDFGCYHLLNSMNVNCFFNYTIPALWNYTMCYYFMCTTPNDKKWYEKGDGRKKSFLVLGVYLAINSNLWTSQILMIYFGVQLLISFIQRAGAEKRRGKRWFTVPFIVSYVVDCFPKFFAIGCWLISMLFEIHSRRGGGFVNNSFKFWESFYALLSAIGSMNRVFLWLVVAINALALFTALVRRRKTHAWDMKFIFWQLEMAACMMLCMVYQVLMGAVLKDGAGYVVRNDTLMTWMLWLLMMTVTSAAYLYRCQPRLQWLAPLLVFVLLIEVVVSYPTYVGNYASSETPSQVKAIDDDIISQIVLADKAGKNTVEVHIPVSISTGWPLDIKNTPPKVGWTLFCHGITERPLTVTFLPDMEKDAQFHLD